MYGYPAIAFAVTLHTSVTLAPRPGPTAVRSPHADERVLDALWTVLEAEGQEVTVATDLPVGRGMGSSAALAVALVRARAARDAEFLDENVTYERAMPIERAFHGNPSGVDVAVSAAGGCLWFCRGDPPVRRRLLPGPWRVVVLDSGSAGDTGQLVALVAAQRPQVDPVLERIGALVADAATVLHDAPALGAVLTENHARLREIGVSTPELDGLVSLALHHGAYGAKLAGAGGGGVVLALVEEPERVLAAARSRGIAAFECRPWVP